MALLARLRQWMRRSAVERAEAERYMSAAERREVDDGPVGYAVDVEAEGQLKPFIDDLDDEGRAP